MRGKFEPVKMHGPRSRSDLKMGAKAVSRALLACVDPTVNPFRVFATAPPKGA